MSDSLRDQLLQAGFQKPKEEAAKKKHRPSGNASNKSARAPSNNKAASYNSNHKGASAKRGKTNTSPSKEIPTESQNKARERDAAIEQRKAIKAQIKTLIEADAIKEFSGEVAYRYTLQNRIRELHVTDPIRQQLVSGALVITRLNGTTYVVPDNTATQIRALNPGWAIVKPNESSTDTVEGYEDFSVPDDLVW